MLASVFVFLASAALPEAVEPCRVLINAKHAGEAVYAEDVEPAACPKRQPAAALRYDARHQQVQARSDLAPGTQLGRAFLPPRPAVAKGDKVVLTVAVGHVSISRGAEAVQSARVGQPFFARTGDGKIIVVPAIQASHEIESTP